MVSKYELSISTGYVPDWGIVEAFRELFQNALDNETTNPENKMGWIYDADTQTIKISNKTSVLKAETLLLGCTTKADDVNTIGKHGEGYKIAFMVLLRNNKKIKVFNYGNRETWEVKLVKSKRYNGQLLTTVFVNKEAIWNKVPNNNLTIEVTGITQEEYNEIVLKNLHLRSSSIEKFSVKDRGSIILNKEEQGNIYVKGLFVKHINKLQFGYDFEPRVLGLDRDRRIVDTFNISWESSILWQVAAADNEELESKALDLINQNMLDVNYIEKTSFNTSIYRSVANAFYTRYGEDAVPVISNIEYEAVKREKLGKPIIVNEKIKDILNQCSDAKSIQCIEVTVKSKLQVLLDKIIDRLTDEEIEEFEDILNELE